MGRIKSNFLLFLDNHDSVVDHQTKVGKILEILERVAVNYKQVGNFTGFERADLFFKTDHGRCVFGAGDDNLDWRHSGSSHLFDFVHRNPQLKITRSAAIIITEGYHTARFYKIS